MKSATIIATATINPQQRYKTQQQFYLQTMKLVLLLTCFALAVTYSSATNAAGLKFLEENKAKEGVVTLPSGLQYKVLTKSTSPNALTPKANSPCSCHYAGTLIDGTEFDSSIKRGSPSTFAPNQVIRGWTEAVSIQKALSIFQSFNTLTALLFTHTI